MTHANRRSLRVFTALTALLLTAAVILSLTGEETVRPAGAAAAIPVSGDWGLSFQNEGQPPWAMPPRRSCPNTGRIIWGIVPKK